MPYGAQLRLSGCKLCTRWPPRSGRVRTPRPALLVRASAEGPPSMPEPNEGPREVSLVRRVPGAGYTFMLAGALKIMTMGWVATGAPRECVRTVAGQYASFMLVPVALLMCLIAKKVVDSGLNESRRFMTFLLGITAFLYFGLYGVLYRYEPRTWHAQQRLQAAAAHARSPYADEVAAGGRRNSNKFIIQRQLEGEYDPRTSAYYNRAPEMQMEEVEARMSGLPAGMVGGAAAAGRAPEVGVGPTLAERKTGPLSNMAPRPQRRAAVPSMYETTSRMPGLDESDF